MGISAGFTLVSFPALSFFWFPALLAPCSAADCGAPVPVSVKALCSIVHFISWLDEQSVPALAVPLVVAVPNGSPWGDVVPLMTPVWPMIMVWLGVWSLSLAAEVFHFLAVPTTDPPILLLVGEAMILLPGLFGRSVPLACIPVPLLTTVLVAKVVLHSPHLVPVVFPYPLCALVANFCRWFLIWARCRRPVLIITALVVVMVATVALLATVLRVWSSVCFNPQFAVFEIGEFSLLVVQMNLTSLLSGQIRRDSNAFSPE